MKIVVKKSSIGVDLIIPNRHHDIRGFFAEVYNQEIYSKNGINCMFVQDNHSLSINPWTMRGLHFQAPPYEQAKLIHCGRGSIFDVSVDIRLGSPTYGKWAGYILSAENGHQLYVPVGFAHGFMTLEPESEIVYKCSNYYEPKTEGTLYWNDPDVGIKWPLDNNLIISEKDSNATSFKNLKSPFTLSNNQ